MVEIRSIITCPECNFSSEEMMPKDACQYFYQCKDCKVMLKPGKGDCCVFCTYGHVRCPPQQEKQGYCD